MNAPYNFNQIKLALDKAKSSGLQTPKLRAGSFVFSLAPATSRNFGSVYVKSKTVYLGKITNNTFYPTHDCTLEQHCELNKIADGDISEAVIAYGREFGSCGCCGRTLVDPVSIKAGVGPICADNFGLNYLRDAASEEIAADKEQASTDLLNKIL